VWWCSLRLVIYHCYFFLYDIAVRLLLLKKSMTGAHAYFYILYLHNPAAAQTNALKTFLESWISSRRTLPQLATCGGCPCLLSVVATRNVC
jgi:hypothetical protein